MILADKKQLRQSAKSDVRSRSYYAADNPIDQLAAALVEVDEAKRLLVAVSAKLETAAMRLAELQATAQAIAAY